MFLVRLAFWVTLVLLLIPAPAPQDAAADAPPPQASVFDALGVAQAAVADVASFCVRNPGTCETGTQLLAGLREKARYGAELAYDFLAEPETGAPAPRAVANDTLPADATSPVASPVDPLPAPAPAAPAGTLNEADRQISWHGVPGG